MFNYDCQVSFFLFPFCGLYFFFNVFVSTLQPQLMLKRDWDLLAVGASMENLSKGHKMVDIGSSISHLYFINSGRCTVEVS